MPQLRTIGTRTIRRPPLFVKIALLRVEEAVSRALYRERSSRVNRDSLGSVPPLWTEPRYWTAGWPDLHCATCGAPQ